MITRIANRKTIYAAVVAVIVVLLVIIALPSVKSAIARAQLEMKPKNEVVEAAADTPTSDAEQQTPTEFKKVGETERLELLFRSSDSAIVVKDKSNGYTWQSAVPIQDAATEGNDLWTASSQSIFHMTFTDPNLPALETQETNSVIEQPKIKTTALDNGISVHYELPRLQISFDMIFELKGNALEVTVPGQSIQEAENNWLMAISPLPFFGAALDHDQGYAIYPDGPGALSTFKSNHPNYLNPYKASVYGSDTISFNNYQRQQNALLPIFGLKVNDNAFLGMITKGEYDANILYSPSGYLINMNRVSSELVYRREYEAVKKDGNLTKKPEKQLLREDHTIRYVFFSGKEADYSHMASAYRQYLIDEKGVAPRIKKGEAIPFGLDLLMGIKEGQILFDHFIPTTSFEEAQDIMEDLNKRGVSSISANLLGWTREGYLEYPSGYKPSSKIGGTSGLKKLSEYAKANNDQLFLQDNYIMAWKGVDGFSTRSDVVVGANHFAVTDRYSELFYLNAGKQNERFQDKVLDPLSKLAITGINFDGIGYTDYYDYNKAYPLNREGTASKWLEMMGKSVDQFGAAASIGGNGYTIPHSSRLFSIPMEDSGYFFTDETIPFYQMVVHGLIPYSGDAQNLFYDPRLQFLKMVEYGYMPYYQFTKKHSEDLKDTYYSDLFSSAYHNWVDQAVDQYKEMSEKLQPVWSQTMVGHRKLEKDVYEVVYEDGSRLIVNYLPREVKIDGHLVPDKDFIVVPKGG
ncbi:DUF5696 domain-containing protein [Paenibacillus sp. CF384]|uniref:DUF5696 domain-containing protein n=1 Tax=Paenibacillus sp. CF384 TaxID=1884382 RepID=UPI00089B9A0B|nr:DUF5696 domain-containing protein [Paenibacillus sp. CF384]SDX06910.1 hypothetical protein SAMN05518855_1008144 [Paenibacillus sp. CF384]